MTYKILRYERPEGKDRLHILSFHKDNMNKYLESNGFSPDEWEYDYKEEWWDYVYTVVYIRRKKTFVEKKVFCESCGFWYAILHKLLDFVF